MRSNALRPVLVAASLVSSTALAHELSCEMSANGVLVAVVREYPAVVTFTMTLHNDHPGAASIVQGAEDPLLGFRLENPVSLPIGGSLTNTFQITLDSQEQCDSLDDSGVPSIAGFTNTLFLRSDTNNAQCSAAVECMPPSPAAAPARDRGFFMTHDAALAACLGDGAVELGREGRVGSLEQAQRLLWSSPALDDTEARSSEASERPELARQVLVSACNQRLFGAAQEARTTLDAATRFLERGVDSPLAQLRRLQAQESDGHLGTLPEGFDAGPAAVKAR